LSVQALLPFRSYRFYVCEGLAGEEKEGSGASRTRVVMRVGASTDVATNSYMMYHHAREGRNLTRITPASWS